MTDPRHVRDEDLLRAVAEHVEGTLAAPCPNADELAAFVTGGLVASEGHTVELHLAQCRECLRVVADLAADPGVMEEPSGRIPSLDATRREPAAGRWALAAAAMILLALGTWALLAGIPDGERPEPTIAQVASALRAAHPDTCADLEPLTLDELARPPTAIERGGVRLYYPIGTVRTARPAFRFEPAAGVEAYELTVLTAEGESVWTAAIARGGAPYPVEKPALEPGKRYLWAVAYERLGRQEGRGTFTVASEAETARFDAALAAIDEDASDRRGLLKAHLAIRRGYWSEAREFAQQALDAAPGRALERATHAYVLAALGASTKEGN